MTKTGLMRVRRVASVLLMFAVGSGRLTGQSTLVINSVSSSGLRANVVGDSPIRQVLVYLPPSYRREQTRRYPVLYLLHGATSKPEEWLNGVYQGMNLLQTLEHPSVFGLAYAISPCCIGFSGRLAPSAPTWPALSAVTDWRTAAEQLRLVLGMVAALDGNRSDPRLFSELPFETRNGTIVPNPGAQSRWLARMPPDLASEMVRRGEHAPTIHIGAGSQEAPILEGIQLLRRRLDSLGVSYSDTTFVGGHIDRVRERFTKGMLPDVGRWFDSSRER